MAKLSDEDVENVIRTNRMGVRKKCYDPFADTGSASALIVLHVRPDGSVSGVDLQRSTGESRVSTCVQAEARGFRFPPSHLGGRFAVPFVFSS